MMPMIGTAPRRLRWSLASAIAILALAGCKDPYSANSYSPGAMQQVSKVDRGVIESFRTVDVRDQGLGSGIGAGTGAVAGGVAGSQIGRSGGNALATLGGVLIGGLIGLAAEHALTDTQAIEYVVRKEDGDLLSVTQKDQQPLAVGQKVLVIYGVQARIVPDQANTAPTTAPAVR